MGYFSNGSEGQDYEHRYCRLCRHGDGDGAGECRVWLAHLLFNGDDASRPVLDGLIPRSEDGLGNGQCRMFIVRSTFRRRRLPLMDATSQ